MVKHFYLIHIETNILLNYSIGTKVKTNLIMLESAFLKLGNFLQIVHDCTW